MWQDIVITSAQFGFILALIPTLRSNDKPPVITSAMNSVLVAIVAAALLTLKLWGTFGTAAIISIIWAVLAFQKHQFNKRKMIE